MSDVETTTSEVAQKPAAALRTIALVCFEEPSTTVGRFAAQAAQALAARGHKVHTYSRDPLGIESEAVQQHVLGSASENDLIGNVRAFTLSVSTRFQISIPQDENAVLLGCEWTAIPALQILSAIRRLPSLLVLHTIERQRSDMTSGLSRQIAAIETEGLLQAKAVFVRGANTLDVARRLIPDFADKVQPLAENFDPSPFRQQLDAGAIKAQYQIGPVDPTILFCGELNEDHGPDLIIKAVPSILKKFPQARFIFVGDGPLFWMLRIYSRYLNLDHAVRITGHLDWKETHALVQACDLLLVPSRKPTENWPILAGWAAGKAVLVSKETAGELVEHEENGIHLLPLPDSCAWGVERVLNDPFIWGRIVENGRAKLNAQFGFDALAGQLAAALQA